MEGASKAAWPDFPFCSARCRLVDLGRWLGEDYTVRADDEWADTVPPEDEPSIP
jgi:endogenous inhibitor of DNA gyrase (YacG/DUF329 family)